jgi:hypothetical protein
MDWTWAKALAMSAMMALVLLGQHLLVLALQKLEVRPPPADHQQIRVVLRTY